jgi:hypothetical protein
MYGLHDIPFKLCNLYICSWNIHSCDGMRGNPTVAANIMHVDFMWLRRLFFKRITVVCLLTDNEIPLRMSNHTMHITPSFARYFIANVPCTNIHAWIRLCIVWTGGGEFLTTSRASKCHIWQANTWTLLVLLKWETSVRYQLTLMWSFRRHLSSYKENMTHRRTPCGQCIKQLGKQ